MSRSAINNAWTKDLKETLNVRKPTKEKKMSESSDSSRETSNSRKRVKLTEKPDTDQRESKPPKRPMELESDPLILQRRQKQIDYGKNTVGYNNYLQKVPITNRTKDDPKTPDKYAKYSRRSWDTLIKMWRKKLHDYDTGTNAGSNTGSHTNSNPESDEDEENENPSE
ncbi:hypothetical protein MSG28_010311 [Choristoneura fumiferana]|uniref:Uncharacterized protein n=2 Tax=Choristoneura fumiferana TaxID=7141 RepID=A0ACC0KK44_CHOFU|nr:hypothetical protein MSG28_010311 [Choristoneura fumiferana]KAI8436859.1 hypothetical protein MSG28_010311 [Choristoneura fumiferana]